MSQRDESASGTEKKQTLNPVATVSIEHLNLVLDQPKGKNCHIVSIELIIVILISAGCVLTMHASR